MQEESVHDPEIEWVTDYEWLGIVYPQDSNETRALITPLAYYDDHQWREVSETVRRQDFPNNGKVAYFRNGPHPLGLNRLYQFRPEMNERVTSEDHHKPYYSYFLVFNPQENKSLCQILNWTNSIPTVLDLPAFLEQGIPINSCFSRIIYIRHGEYLYGPIHLEAEGKLLKAREYRSATYSGGKQLFLKKYSFSKQAAFELEGQFFIDSDTQSFVPPLGEIDCSLPQVTIKAALKAYKDIGDKAERMQLVDKRINELASLYSSTNPDAPAIKQCVIERAQYLVKSQLKMIGDLQNVLEALPDDHDLFVKARNHVIQHQKSEIEREVQRDRDSLMENLSEFEQELQRRKRTMEDDEAKEAAKIQSRLQQLQLKVDSVEQERAGAQAELEGIWQKIERARAQSEQMQEELQSFELHMKDRLEQLRQEPGRVLAELEISSALQQAFLSLFAQDHAATAMPEQPVMQKTQVDNHSVAVPSPVVEQSRVVVSLPQFFTENSSTLLSVSSVISTPKFFANVAKQSGVTRESIRVHTAVLLAGLVPAFNSPAASYALQAVAQVIADNRFWSIPVPVTALSPLDVLGTITSENRQFIPTNDLADIILEAQRHPQQLGIVLLEGVDRVPFLPVIAPFIQQYRAVRQQKQLAIKSAISPLRLFHPRALAHDDPYLPLASFCWPANLLLAVTVDQAPGNFAIPEACVAWFTYPEIKERGRKNLEKQDMQQISADDWYAYEKEFFQREQSAINKDLLEAIAWSELEPSQKAFVNAAVEMKMERSEILKQLQLDESEQ